MEITAKSDNRPLHVDLSEGKIVSSPDSRVYLKFNPHHKSLPKRHPGELVLRNGWAHLDYDEEGFLVGIEVVEGDPFTGVTECIPYLQPVNPLIQ